MPSLTTPLEQFLTKLDDHKDIWWGLASQTVRPLGRLYGNPYYSPPPYHNPRNPYHNSLYQNKDQSRFANFASQLESRNNAQPQPREYPHKQAQDETNPGQESARHIEAPKPKLKITAGPANGSDLLSRNTNQKNSPYQGNLFRPTENQTQAR